MSNQETYERNITDVGILQGILACNYDSMSREEFYAIAMRITQLLENSMIMMPSVATDSSSNNTYSQYVRNKEKPKLKSKFYSNIEETNQVSQCEICMESYALDFQLTLGCGHKFCAHCVSSHFHHSVANQPDNKYYSCPKCRDDVKVVTFNYSRKNAKNKKELMSNALVTHFRSWCK